jgi:acyl-CoA reductase-like NAD-dependent aldehyde dehydrogenase
MATEHNSHSHDTENALSTDERKHMSDATYAFPKQRKEPLNDASHVRNAIARFDQVKDVSDEEREEAFKNIKAAAKKHGVEMKETSWRQLGGKPHTENAAQKKASLVRC